MQWRRGGAEWSCQRSIGDLVSNNCRRGGQVVRYQIADGSPTTPFHSTPSSSHLDSPSLTHLHPISTPFLTPPCSSPFPLVSLSYPPPPCFTVFPFLSYHDPSSPECCYYPIPSSPLFHHSPFVLCFQSLTMLSQTVAQSLSNSHLLCKILYILP